MPSKEPRENPLKAVKPPLEPAPIWADVYPWADTRSFYVHSKHSQEKTPTYKAEVRIPLEWAEKMLEIVQSGKFPALKTTSDCMRDALWRWQRLMADAGEDVESKRELDRQRRQNKLKALRNRGVELRDMVEDASFVLDNDTDPKAHRDALKELSAQLLELEEGSEIRERIIKIVAKHHGKI